MASGPIRFDRVGRIPYWINGVPTFEQAQAAGAARRRACARAHRRVFARSVIPAAIYLAFSAVLDLPDWLDISLTVLAVITAALRTIRLPW